MAEPDATLLSTAKVAASNLLPGYLTMLRGDPNAETMLGRNIPGGVQGVVGGVGGFAVDLANLLGNEIPRAAGYNTGLPHVDTPEFIQLAQQHHAGAAQAANETIAPVEPQNAIERVAGNTARALAETGFPLPLGLATRFVPSAARTAVGLIAPAAMSPIRAGVPIGGTVGALSTLHEATKPADVSGTEYDLPGETTKGVSTPTPSTTEYDLPSDVAPTPTQGAKSYDLPSDVGASDQQVPDLGTLNIPRRDQTTTPLAHVIEGVGALLGAAIAHRPVRSLWGAVTDAKRQVEYAEQRNAVGLATADPAAIKPPGYDPTQPVDVPQVQLPGDTGAATWIKTTFVDENARTQQVMADYADSPAEAKAVKRIYGQINDRLSAQNRAREFFETGIEPTTKVQLPSLGSYARRYAALDPEMQAKIDTTAKYRNELNNRDIMFRKELATNPTITADDPSLRNSLWEMPTSDIRSKATANMNDPVVRSFIDEYDGMKQAYLQHVADRGLISQDTANNLMNAHPNHISRVDPTGHIVDILGPRDLTTRGGPNILAENFVQTMVDQLPQMIRAAEKNDANRMLVETFLNGQRADPRKPIVITEIPERAPGGGPIKDEQRNLLTVGYGTGARTFHVHDVRIFNLMTKGQAFLGPALQGIAHATQMLQSTTTGALALLGGRFFGATTNLPRNILAGSTQRPAGMAGGLTDKALQTITGGRIGLRVADPLSIAGSAYELAAGSAAMFAKGVANTLERNQASGARLLRSMLGEQGTRNMIDALNTAYAKSNLSQARSEGAAGGGQGSRSRVAALGNTLPTGLSRAEVNAALAKPYVSAQTNVPELYHGNRTAFGIRARAMLNDFNNLMNDAYHLHVRRINPKMDTLERAYEVSQLVGAPGQTGSSRSFRSYASLVPYLNPSIQGTARAGRSYNEAPLGTMFGKLATYTMMLAAEQWISMQGGPVHQDWLKNILTTRQLAGNAIFQFNGNDPNDYAKVPFPQEDWWMVPIIRSALEHITTAWQAQGDESYRQRLINGMGSWFHDYMTPKEKEGVLYGFAQLVDPILQLPPAVNAVFNMAGLRYRGDTTAMVQAAQAGRDIAGKQGILTTSINDPYHLPGQNLSAEGGDVGILNAMLASVFGAMYTTASQIGGEAAHAKTFGEFLSGAGDVLQSRFRQLNPLFGSVLYPGVNPISPRGSPEQQFVTNTMHNLKDVGSLRSGEASAGFTRKGGESIEMRGNQALSPDPIMHQLLEQASALHNHLEKDVQRHINDLDKLRQNIQASHEPQDMKRKIGDDYARQLQMAYINAQQIISVANEQASILVGAPVDFAMPIAWGQGSIQFFKGQPAGAGQQFDLPQ